MQKRREREREREGKRERGKRESDMWAGGTCTSSMQESCQSPPWSQACIDALKSFK